MDKNIIVLFSPGLGGNHVANLISTDKRFEKRATLEQYKNHNERNAHFYTEQNAIFIKKNLLKVHCLHLGSFLWHCDAIKQNLSDFVLLVINIPNQNTSAYTRYVSFNNNLPYYLVEEQKTLYSHDNLMKLTQHKDFHFISSEIIFSENIDAFINFTHTQMGITVDVATCKSMHHYWYSKIRT